MQVRGEEYDRVVIKKEQEQLYFDKNYGELWKQLTCHNLHDLGAGDWHDLSSKLIQLHAGAYTWHPSAQTISDIMTAAAKATGGQEVRLKIKALVERLDLVQQEESVLSGSYTGKR